MRDKEVAGMELRHVRDGTHRGRLGIETRGIVGSWASHLELVRRSG